MEDISYISIIISFLGGFGLFIYGMHLLSSGLQKSAGKKMKKLLEALTKNKFMGLLLGTLVTAIIQSSTATTVMVIGFVNAGIMSLTQSIGIIMGANIGTTATAWIVSSMEWSKNWLMLFKPEMLAQILIAVGAILVLFFKKKSLNQAGKIIVGFGILFFGMTAMTSAFEPLSESEFVISLFKTLGGNPLLGLLAGIIVTAIIQSSSASVGILQSLAMANIIPWNAAVYIIMGQNIGTSCSTGLISTIGATKNAKAAAYIHLIFNVIGSVIFTIFSVVFFKFINPDFGNRLITTTQISIVHTAFNVATVIILYPFSNYIIMMSERLAAIKKGEEENIESVRLDDRVLNTPAFAVQLCLKEISRLADIVLKNLDVSIQSFLEKDISKVEEIVEREKNIDEIEKSITQYLVKVCNQDVVEDENKNLTSLFHILNDIERIGDHCENISEVTELLVEENAILSKVAQEGLKEMINLTVECYRNSVEAFKTGNTALAVKVLEAEEKVDMLEENLRSEHIKRLASNKCNTTAGVIFLDMITNLERITDHANNIASYILDDKSSKKAKNKRVKEKSNVLKKSSNKSNY